MDFVPCWGTVWGLGIQKEVPARHLYLRERERKNIADLVFGRKKDHIETIEAVVRV